MLEVYAHTGMYLLAKLGIQVYEGEDILSAIDEKVSEHGIDSLGCPYSTEDCEFYQTPVNGGQYWIPELEVR